MSNQLLPPNATRLERALADTLNQPCPLPITQLWSPEHCPLALLPYLAWARSVDRWDPNWPEATKRLMVSNAFYIHQHKGTLSALKRVIAPFAGDFKITEWWQTTPPGAPGTFTIVLSVIETGISEETYLELQRLLDDAKPASRPYALTIAVKSLGHCSVQLGCFDGDVLVIQALLGTINDPALPALYCATVGCFDGDLLVIHPLDSLHGE